MSEAPESKTRPVLSDAALRRRRGTIAGHRGDAEAARAGLVDEDPDVRSSALRALERLGLLQSSELATALTDPSDLVRRRGILIAAGRDDVATELLSCLDDPSDVVVEAAAFALGERPGGSADVVTRLSAIVVGHEDSLCRESAVAALGAIGDPNSLDSVLTACGDKATVRRRAVLALAAFDGQVVTDKLEELLGDRDLQVRQAAEELLAIELGEEL